MTRLVEGQATSILRAAYAPVLRELQAGGFAAAANQPPRRFVVQQDLFDAYTEEVENSGRVVACRVERINDREVESRLLQGIPVTSDGFPGWKVELRDEPSRPTLIREYGYLVN